ncbi:MAG: pimeloyl-ACP methyl ester carboxylesterase [Paracoccaceae bacterium]|jgi:pimeloyl-ACP methyl ester carboxylesterase
MTDINHSNPQTETAATPRTNPQIKPRTDKVRCISRHGFHQIAYQDWGAKRARDMILCVHGLTRNSRDFDPLATRLAETHRVICPDLAGRGQSDWLDDPADYNLLQYNMDITTLAAKLGYDEFTWIGTSLGGLMGMSLAGIKNTPIRRIIINDVAPEIPYPALRRITGYMGATKHFPDLAAVEQHLRTTLSPFGPMNDNDWARMALHSAVAAGDGFKMHNDPEIMQNFRQYWVFMHFALWRYWDKITCPVLILRGKKSDFLTSRLLEKMLERLPHAQAIEFDGVGHTPTLNAPDQIDPIINWLAET